jgi:hypothetical protein
MAVGAIPSWQRKPAAAPVEVAEDPGRLAWPLACLLIGGISAMLWSLVWAAVSTLLG